MEQNLDSEKLVCEEILEKFPEFKEYKEYGLWDSHNPYLFVANFAHFLVDKIREKEDSDSVVKRAFNFLNQKFNTTDDERVLTLLHVEIFENLLISKKAVQVAKSELKEHALKEFLEMMPDFNVGVEE